jgi:hypothetical protein
MARLEDKKIEIFLYPLPDQIITTQKGDRKVGAVLHASSISSDLVLITTYSVRGTLLDIELRQRGD